MSLTPKSESKKRFGPATRLVHAGRDPSEQHGFVNTPIYRGSTVLFPSYDDLQHRRGRYTYGTHGTPTRTPSATPGANSPVPRARWRPPRASPPSPSR